MTMIKEVEKKELMDALATLQASGGYLWLKNAEQMTLIHLEPLEKGFAVWYADRDSHSPIGDVKNYLDSFLKEQGQPLDHLRVVGRAAKLGSFLDRSVPVAPNLRHLPQDELFNVLTKRIQAEKALFTEAQTKQAEQQPYKLSTNPSRFLNTSEAPGVQDPNKPGYKR